MPFQPIVPTWLAWNNGNFTSPTALTDLRTGQPFAAGGLNLGDYFDATNEEAKQGSYTTNGTLFAGRYRFVQVDSGATAANVRTGTVGYLRAGTYMQSVVILTVGTGQTAGTYNVAANAGNGGTGALIQVVVGSAGTVTSATVLQGGYGYTAAPTFTLVTGGTPGTVVAQLNTTPNLVTSADIAPNAVRPVVFLNSITPGNYGFVQELGTATVLTTAAQTQAVNQFAIVKSSSADGTMTASSATFSIYAIGQVIDPLTTPLVNTPFKIQLGYAAGVVQD
jgi:hypothetical protein